jgi:hypothetical protein
MAYTRSDESQAQFDRLIAGIEQKLSTRLLLVKAIDKQVTGILLFAK